MTRAKFSTFEGLEVRRSPTAGEISGYGVTFGGSPNAYNEVVAKGAFAKSLAIHQRERTRPLMLWAHFMDKPVGSWIEFHEDDRGLFVRGKFNLSTAHGRDAYEHVKAGDVSGLSIGFYARAEDRKRQPDGTFLLTNADLVEISVVAFPADKRARIDRPIDLRSVSQTIQRHKTASLIRTIEAQTAKLRGVK